MDVRQLAAIVAVADHGTFSAAAQALFTVQSNVSGHVAKLERELGATLVDRSKSTLTVEGVRVVERARRILHEIDDIATDIASLDDDITGDVRIGVIGTTARWLVPELLGAVALAHPRIRPIVSAASTTTIVPGLLTGKLHAGVVHLPLDNPELTATPLFSEDLIVLAPRDHPLADETEISLTEVSRHHLLLPPKGTALRQILDRAATSANLTLRSQAEIDGARLLASLVVDGHGAAIVPATAAPSQLGGDLARVRVPGLPRRVVAWTRKRHTSLHPAVRAVEHTLRATIGNHAHHQYGIHAELAPYPT